MELAEFSALARKIESEVAQVIVGQDEVVRQVLICILAGRHALLEGVPGLGKTQLIRTLADALTLEFNRIQFTPDLMPSDVTGTNIMEDTEEGRKASVSNPDHSLPICFWQMKSTVPHPKRNRHF